MSFAICIGMTALITFIVKDMLARGNDMALKLCRGFVGIIMGITGCDYHYRMLYLCPILMIALLLFGGLRALPILIGILVFMVLWGRIVDKG